MKSIIPATMLAAALTLAACSGNKQDQQPQPHDSSTVAPGQKDSAPPGGTMTPPRADTASTTGTIARIDTAAVAGQNILGSLTLEDRNNADTANNKAVVRVLNSTGISAEENGKRVPKTFSDLKSGMVVRALFSGPIPMIYPMRVNADEIVIVK